MFDRLDRRVDTRVHKVWRDMARHRARSLLVVAAVAIGLIGAGAVLNAWALVQRATELGYRASLPVSATFSVDRLDAALLTEIRALLGVAAARARRTQPAAVQSGGSWRAALIVALDDFKAADIGRLEADGAADDGDGGGHWPPRDGELVIERSSLEFSGATVGEPLALKLTGSRNASDAQSIAVGGLVRDVSLAPGWMEHVVYGYASLATLEKLGAAPGYNELQIRVTDAGADRPANRVEVRRIAATVKARLLLAGVRVGSVDVPEPGQHIHAAQMDSLLMTQGAFGLLALLVCAFLVVNLIHATLAGQAREIGVMKVLGASAGQIAALYLSQALLLGLLASLLALPAALFIGRQYAGLKAELLNFPIDGYAIPWWAIALQLGVGALLPVAAAALPVRRACRMSVGAALRDIGIVAPGQALAARRWTGATRWIGRPLLLAIGNAFRRRQRMVLTLLALASGGAVCLGAANLRTAVLGSVDLLYAAQAFDVSLRLAEPRPAAALEAAATAVDGVARAEAWRGKRATLVEADHSADNSADQSADQSADHSPGDSFSLLGLPPNTALLNPVLIEGRWLRDSDNHSDSRALVVNRSWLRSRPALKPGHQVRLNIDGRTQAWTLVGSIDAGPQPLAYTARASLDALSGDTLATTLVVTTQLRGPATQLDAIQRLRGALAETGMTVASSQLQSEGRRVAEDHLLMVVDFLGAMAWVMIVVGGMGLASTMSLAVLERQREIGVLRAIGAHNSVIMAMVQVEGLVIVALAWFVSLPLSVPMSVLLAEAFGRIMFPVTTPYLPGAMAAMRWLALMVLIAVLACAWPARRATRVPAALALSYE